MRILIRHGDVVTASSRTTADVLVDGERIAEIGPALGAAADRTIDAAGCLVLPGGVDVHTHLDMPLDNGVRTADDFESGTVAAAFGGTTTIVDYATQTPGRSLTEALDTWMRRAEGRSVIDYAFHMAISELRPEIEEEMDDIVRAGVPSFKLFMAYPGRLMLDDGAIFRVLRRTAANGGLVCLHAENGPVIDVLVREAVRAGHTEPRYHALTRPPSVEAEAVQRGIALARMAGARLYIVHVSSDLGAEAVRSAQQRGLPVFGETCPQYLYLSEACYARPRLEAAKFVMSPPLRTAGSQKALWAALAEGTLQVVATDHCPFRLEDKDAGGADFSRIPNGGPGIEARLLLMFQGVAEGRLSLQQMVEATAAAPARLFGLAPRKGSIAVGADADLVILDPSRTTRLSAATHHMRVDYDLFEGREVRGAIETVLSRGEIVIHAGRFEGAAGRGRFLPRSAGV
jgi:dihydropyrimidinase